jgi:hypothetical protein
MTKLKFNVAHQVPGRVRMKVPAAKGNPDLLQQIAETFATIPGIERITVNPATGSVVMHYDVHRHDEFHGRFQDHVEQAGGMGPPLTEIDQFARRIEEEAEFLARHPQSARAVVDFFKHCDREIRGATDNYVDLKIGLDSPSSKSASPRRRRYGSRAGVSAIASREGQVANRENS